MNLAEIIAKVLSNSQIDLILTENGFDWAPKSNNWSTQYLSLLDREGMLQATHTGEPNAEDLAEWVRENANQWIQVAIDNEEDEHEPNRERVTFLEHLFSVI